MDYVAKAQEASRRWREAQGLPPRTDLLSDQSFPSSVPKKERVQEEQERLARECSTTETIETTKEGEERTESKGIQRPSEPALETTKAAGSTTKTFCPSVLLNPRTVKEALGAQPDPHDLACLRFDVLAAIHQLEAEIKAGTFAPLPLLVCGIPLGLWVDLTLVAAWLKRKAATPPHGPRWM
jgi:hypothetical protein